MNLNLPELHDKQKQVLEYASQEHPCQVITIVAGRRGGKSHGCAAILFFWSFQKEKTKSWYITRSDRQVKEFYNEFIVPFITACPQLIKSSSSGKGVFAVEFINGSKIEFKSSLAGNSLLGAGLDFAIVDEAAYVDEDVVQRIIMPMFATKRSGEIRSKVIIASSPAGTGNYVYKKYSDGLDLNQNMLRSVHFTVFDNPAKNDEWLKTMKSQLSPAQYDQEVLGLFTDSANIFQNVDACSILNHQLEITKGRKTWVSVDIGLVNDATTIFLLSSKEGDINTLQVLSFWRLIKPHVNEIKDLLVDINAKYKPQKIVVESNNQGLPIIQSLHFDNKLLNVEPFTTTQLSKSIIINNLSYLFSQRKIELVDDVQLRKELKAFAAVPQKNGRVKMYGVNESDDLVMGLSIGAHYWAKEKTSGQYFVKVL